MVSPLLFLLFLQGNSFLNSLLEENLHSSLTSLPRLMRTSEDVKKIHSLNLVLGYLNLLEKRFSSLLNSSSHLRRLSLALVQVMKTSFPNFSPGPSLIKRKMLCSLKLLKRLYSLSFWLVGYCVVLDEKINEIIIDSDQAANKILNYHVFRKF